MTVVLYIKSADSGGSTTKYVLTSVNSAGLFAQLQKLAKKTTPTVINAILDLRKAKKINEKATLQSIATNADILEILNNTFRNEE